MAEHSSLFEKYVEIIEQSIPIGMIINDFSDHSLMIKDLNSESVKQTQLIYESLLNGLLNDGMSKADAISHLEKFDLFQNISKNALQRD